MESDQTTSPLATKTFVAAIDVALDQGPKHPLTYGVSKEQLGYLAPGQRVLVPLKNHLRRGSIIGIKEHIPQQLPTLRPVHSFLSKTPLLSQEMLTLVNWVSRYYSTPICQTLKTVLPAPIREDTKEKKQLALFLTKSPEEVESFLSSKKIPSSQKKVLQALLVDSSPPLLTAFLKKLQISKSPILSLVQVGMIALKQTKVDRFPSQSLEFLPTKPKTLHREQSAALMAIQESLQCNRFQTHLLHGITGSGKTEIYLQAIAIARKQKKGVIFLVPEIALTSQTIERLSARLGEKIGIVHSKLSSGERVDMWHAMQQGKIAITIGARSAIFSPLSHLGLIIVDEEHDHSYKQTEEQPCYHARDVAIMRGKLTLSTVILGSATPSLESYANASSGKYHLSTLSSRATTCSLPTVSFIDMKREWDKKRGYQLLSDPLIQEIKTRFSIGEQTLLFLNKRGYQTVQLCKQCGEVMKCSQCDVSLTFHKQEKTMRCHFCGFSLSPPPTICPSCGQKEHLEYKGVGTQKVEQTLWTLIPGIRTIRMDADTTKRKGSHDTLFKQFRSGKADVLIGTQMIAKGLHFPNVTLVGILNSDSALHVPDFRSSETLFQLLVQVSGRAGRSDIPGKVLIQTCLENHPVFHLAATSNYAKFFSREMEGRKEFVFPPFTRLAKLLFSGPNAEKTRQFGNAFRSRLLSMLDSSFTLYPLIPCGYPKIQNRYRFKLLIKGKNIYTLSAKVGELAQTFPPHRPLRLLVDIDPISTF